MNQYLRWLLPIALLGLVSGDAYAEDSLLSALGKLQPEAKRLLQEVYDESCIVLDSLDRIAKSRSSSKSKTTEDWDTVAGNHRDYWSTRIQKAAKLLGTTTEGGTAKDPEIRTPTFPSSYRTWVRAQGAFFDDVRTKGAAWISRKRWSQVFLDSTAKRFKEDPEKYADVVTEFEAIDAELKEIEAALPKAATHGEALALRRRADKAWNKAYKNACFLRTRQSDIKIFRSANAGILKDGQEDLKKLRAWRDEVKANKGIEPRFVASLVDVWEPEMKKLIEHLEAAVRNIEYVDDQVIKETLLGKIPRWNGVAFADIELQVASVLHLATEREKALR